MDLERHDAAAMRTAHIVVSGDRSSNLRGFPSAEVEWVQGDTHITVQVADPAQLYDILDLLRDINATLLSLQVDL